MNPGQEKMIAEMGIGPVWKLRSNSVEQSMSLQAMSAVNFPSKPGNRIDLGEQGLTGSGLNSVPNNAICQTCGWCQIPSNTPQVEPAIRPSYLFVHEYNSDSDSAQVLVSKDVEDQLLNSILRELEIKRGANAYVVGILKTKPVSVVAGQFDGPEAEIFACLSCAKKQIELISPSIIISFGSVAANSLLGFDAEIVISDLRGRLHHYGKTPLIVTHELSYILQQPKEKRTLWLDLCLATNAIQNN